MGRRNMPRPEPDNNVSVSTLTQVVVTGSTFKSKDQFKTIGGTWNTACKGWVFPEEKRDEVLKILASAKYEVSEQDKYEAPGLPEPSSSANAELTLEPYKKSLLLKGDTKEVKTQLSGCGGSWNRTLGGWIFRTQQKDTLLALLRADPSNTIQEVPAGSTEAAGKRKRDADDEFIED